MSRGTIRAALADLADDEYIATRGGIGSVVTFDGATLDPRGGWARSIAASGTEVTTRILRLVRLDDPRLQTEVDAAEATFVAVDRLRTVVGGRPVSLERSVLPHVGRLAAATTDGLVDDSLTATIAEAGLVPAEAEQWVDVVPLDVDDAALLDRPAGTPFLRSRRVSRTADGAFVERVDSLLDPDRFRLHMRFGTAR
ncbi:hypothetical protein Cus16_1312 [Curtobacterium sp. ER1/6]|nr:hypothetical protein Cus16_1312 [Curtobacterium sp. ER1/6]